MGTMTIWIILMQISLNHVVISLQEKITASIKAHHMQKMQNSKCLKERQKQAMSYELPHFPNEVIDVMMSFLYVSFESYETTIDQELASGRAVISMLASVEADGDFDATKIVTIIHQ